MTTNCFHFENIAIEVKSVKGNCSARFHVGDRFSLETIVPKGLCPFLYHAILPYLEAMENGAVFKRPKNNFIIIQCSNPGVGVAVKIHQTKGKETQISITAAHTGKSNCSYYHFEIGDHWPLRRDPTTFCRRAYDSIFPYLNALSSQIRTDSVDKDALTVTCPSHPDFVTFQVISL